MGDEANKLRLFMQQKQQTLNKEDLSLKGSIDEPIRPLLELINNNDHYYTTSTCSGRVTISEKPLGESNIKKGNKFLYSCHAQPALEDLVAVLDSYRASLHETADVGGDSRSIKCLWFKFEPFIMHIRCYDLEAAKSLLNLGLAAGCRNSGITLGKTDKFMLALRSTSSMEVPIFSAEKFEVSRSYIEFLHQESTQRMSDNSDRLTKLYSAIDCFLAQKLAGDIR